MAQKKGYKQTNRHIENRSLSLRKGSFFYCLVCSSKFWRKPYEIKKGNNKFCSKKCYFVWQKGRVKDLSNRRSYKDENNPNWKGGITPENKKLRGGDSFKEWREAVFKRDNWTCQKCGARSKKNKYIIIHAHHIKPFATFPKLRFDIDNGLTLCKKCHDKEPKGNDVYKIRG